MYHSWSQEWILVPNKCAFPHSAKFISISSNPFFSGCEITKAQPFIECITSPAYPGTYKVQLWVALSAEHLNGDGTLAPAAGGVDLTYTFVQDVTATDILNNSGALSAERTLGMGGGGLLSMAGNFLTLKQGVNAHIELLVEFVHVARVLVAVDRLEPRGASLDTPTRG